MDSEADDLEAKREFQGKNWIERSKILAEELKTRNPSIGDKSNNKSREKEPLSTNHSFDEQSEWRLKINKYIEADSKIKRTKAAAAIAVTEASSEKKLLTAIELAKSGYAICSLNSALSIIEDKDLNKIERTQAFFLIAENILTTTNALQKYPEESLSAEELLHGLTLNEKLIKAIRIALTPEDKNIKDLSIALHDLIYFASKQTSNKSYKEEAHELRIAQERKSITQKMTILYKKPIIRTIHHLACTGGTLFAKCLASMHNIALVNEVNPLNRFGSKFEPTNPLLLLERGYRELTTEERIDIFKAQIDQAYNICGKDDVDLVLRDHSHTDFHQGSQVSSIRPIRDSLSNHYELISLVTIRHPLDSYLGLVASGWEKQFFPSNLNEYSKRYLSFVQSYSDLKFIRYEDLCSNPISTMQEVCKILEIQYNNNFINTFGNHCLSGDSGRTGIKIIEKRTRRPIPKDLEPYLEKSKYYLELIKTLGY